MRTGLGLTPLLLAAVVIGCGGPAPIASPNDTVAQVGELAVPRSEFDLYLSLNLLPGDEGDAGGSEGLDRVKSRLLDALIDEKTLFVEAQRRGLSVSDFEIDAYLGTDVEDEPVVGSLSDNRRRHLVHQRMMVQKLQEAIANELPPADAGEVRAYIEQSRGRLVPRRRVRLRALRFESPDSATQVASRIHAGRMSFAEAVVNYETNPGQGVALDLSWDTLAPDVQQALDGLERGQVSRPVDFNGDTFLFQIDSWLTKPAQMDEELLRRAGIELERGRRRQASEELLLTLREKTPIRIHEERLTFRYKR